MNFVIRLAVRVLVGATLTAQFQTQPAANAAAPAASIRAPGPQPRHFESLAGMHAADLTQFASKPGFGAGRVAFLPPQDLLTHGGIRYRFSKPDLIGLERSETAYVAPHDLITVAGLSRKDARGRLHQRELAPDETQAVKRLREGETLVTLPRAVTNTTPRGSEPLAGWLAVGPLRATATCAHCHDVPEGTLLGAFAYTLVPEIGLTNGLAVVRASPKAESPVGTTLARHRAEPVRTNRPVRWTHLAAGLAQRHAHDQRAPRTP